MYGIYKRSILAFVIIWCTCLEAARYLPVVLVHGIMSDAYYMEPIKDFIHEYMGDDVYVKNVEIGEGTRTSFINMEYQITLLRTAIEQDPNLRNGFNIIAHSQGTLIARAYIEQYNKPRVFNYISFGGPQQGVFGTPGDFDTRFRFLDYVESLQYYILYSSFAQRFISFAGYWHDTLHNDAYLANCRFLPRINNEIEHPLKEQFKNNICSLTNVVLVSSDKDDIIEPISSCHFGFYKLDSQSEQESLFETDLYKQDKLGLKILNETGRLHFRMAHCTHTDYQRDKQNFKENALPFLMLDPE